MKTSAETLEKLRVIAKSRSLDVVVVFQALPGLVEDVDELRALLSEARGSIHQGWAKPDDLDNPWRPLSVRELLRRIDELLGSHVPARVGVDAEIQRLTDELAAMRQFARVERCPKCTGVGPCALCEGEGFVRLPEAP